MATWSISGTGLQNFYQRLQEVSSLVRDGDGRVPESVIIKHSPDAYLSADDMDLWMKKNSAGERRNELYFVEKRNGGPKVRRSTLAELSILYSYLVTLDFTDGRFDGQVRNMPASVDVPGDVDEMAVFASVYRRAVFDVRVTYRNAAPARATAWVRKKEKVKEGQWRYHLVTNAHVLDSVRREEIDYHVRSAGGKTYRAKIAGVDHAHDVGILTFIADAEFPTLPITLSLPTVGEKIAELGNQEALGIAYIPGVVNTVPDFSSGRSMPVIRYDSNSSRGSSGSPVFNTRGEVIGMDFSGVENDMGASIGYAVPMLVADESYQQLSRSGKYEDGGSFEADCRVLSAHELSTLGINAPVGYYIRRVDIGSRAERAGLKAGHILIAADGADLPDDWQQFEYELGRKSADQKIALDVVTIGEPDKKTTLEYTVDKRSTPHFLSWETPFGFTVLEMDRETGEELAETGGPNKIRGVRVRIAGQNGGSPEAYSNFGVPDGAVIEAVGSIPVKSVAEFHGAIYKSLTSRSVPIAIRLISTARSGPYPGFRSICLINGIEKRRQEENGELGIKYIELDDTEKETLEIDTDLKAFYVTQIEDRVIGADQEELFEGDVIVGYNKQPLTGRRIGLGIPIIGVLLKALGIDSVLSSSRTKTFDEFVGSAERDKAYSLQVKRNGQDTDVKRTVGGRLYPRPLSGRVWMGSERVLAYLLTDEMKKRLHLDEKISGVYVIVRSPEGAPDHPYRLESGMVVTGINGRTVKDPKDFYKMLSEAARQKQPVVFEVAGNIQWQYPGYSDFYIVNLF